MHELEVNWRIAAELIGRHAAKMNAITFSMLLVIFLITAAIVKVAGYPLMIIFETIWDYKIIVIPLVLFIHFIPVSIYALVKLLRRQPFTHFKVVIVKNDNPPPPVNW